MTDHATPRPWVLDGFVIADPNGDTPTGRWGIASAEPRTNPVEKQANAALIVRAVNCHDELVAALEALLHEVDRCDDAATWRLADVEANARAALARAREE